MWQIYFRESPKWELLVKIIYCCGQGSRVSSSHQLHKHQSQSCTCRWELPRQGGPKHSSNGICRWSFHPRHRKKQQQRAKGNKTFPLPKRSLFAMTLTCHGARDRFHITIITQLFKINKHTYVSSINVIPKYSFSFRLKCEATRSSNSRDKSLGYWKNKNILIHFIPGFS